MFLKNSPSMQDVLLPSRGFASQSREKADFFVLHQSGEKLKP
jgi:hypothetical protein